MAKRSKEASKLAPYLGGHSGAPVEGSFAGDLQALINALNAHKLSDDHDKINHTWSGIQQFLQTMITASVIPSLADSYDIGSETRRFRKGFFSELSSLIFKKDNIIVLDGRLLISKMAGVLPAAVLSTDSAIDFGETMIPGDILIMRSEGQMEYVQVEALISGTTYEVERNLDGSGANDWPEGEPFAVLGSEGDGWLELSAVEERRFSVFVMGATFNSAVEIARYGEITGWQNAAFSGIGLAFGNFAAKKYFISTDVDGMVAVGLSLKIGSGEKDVDLTGIQIDDTEIVGQNNGVDQIVIGSDGALEAGEGNVRLDEQGIKLYNSNEIYSDQGAIHFIGDSNPAHPTETGAIWSLNNDNLSNLYIQSYRHGFYSTAISNIFIQTKTEYVDDRSILLTTEAIDPMDGWAELKLCTDKDLPSGSQNYISMFADKVILDADLSVDGTIKDGDGVEYSKSTHTHDHGSLTGLGDNDHPQYRLANSVKMTSLASMADNTASSITPTNAQGILFLRTLGGDVMAAVFYDAISPTAYCSLLTGNANVAVRTGALSGTTGSDGKFTISAHTDGKIYLENRCGTTLYPGYIAL